MDCGLFFREIGKHVGRNQATVMRICNLWMQEGTTERSHPPHCTTVRDDRHIVRRAVIDRAATSRNTAQQIQSVTHHAVSARTIRRRLQQNGLSARRPLLRLPLTLNHRHLCRQWCVERWTWTTEWNDIVFTDESRFCLQNHDGRIRVWRYLGERLLNPCVMPRHTGHASSIMVWSGIGIHSRTPLVRIEGTLTSQRYIFEVLEPIVLPYFQRLSSAIFLQDNARPHTMFKSSCSLGLLVRPIYRQSKTYGPCLQNDWPRIHHPLLHQINCDNMYKPHGILYPNETSKVFVYAETCGSSYSQQWRLHLLIFSSSTLPKRLHFKSLALCTTCYLPNKF